MSSLGGAGAPRAVAAAPAAGAGRRREHLGAADQQARIDAERPADDAEHHDGADAEPAAADRHADAAATAAAIAAAILDVVALRQIVLAHRFSSRPGSLADQQASSPSPATSSNARATPALRHVVTPIARRTMPRPYGYSDAIADSQIVCELSRFLPWAAMMQRVGCQVPRRRPRRLSQSSESWLCRVAGRPVRTPRFILSLRVRAHPASAIASPRWRGCRRTRSTSSSPIRPTICSSRATSSGPTIRASTRSTTTGTSSRALRPMTISPAPGCWPAAA